MDLESHAITAQALGRCPKTKKDHLSTTFRTSWLVSMLVCPFAYQSACLSVSLPASVSILQPIFIGTDITQVFLSIWDLLLFS